MFEKVQAYAKFVVAVAAVLGEIAVAVLPVVPDDWKPALHIAVALLGAIAVYRVPNTPAPATFR